MIAVSSALSDDARPKLRKFLTDLNPFSCFERLTRDPDHSVSIVVVEVIMDMVMIPDARVADVGACCDCPDLLGSLLSRRHVGQSLDLLQVGINCFV